MEIKSTSNQEHARINMLVYGDPGVGKTTFAASAQRPGEKNVLLLDCESGMLSLKDVDIDYLKINTFQDMREALAWIKKNGAQYDTIVIDTISELMVKLVDELKNDARFNNKQEGLSMQGWGTAIDKIKMLIRAFRDLDKNVIMLAHVIEKEDENKVIKKPSLQGKTLPNDICKAMDIVGFMTTVVTKDGETKHILIVEPNEKYYAKSRFPILNAVIPPNFLEITDAAIRNKQFQWTKKQDAKVAAFEAPLDEQLIDEAADADKAAAEQPAPTEEQKPGEPSFEEKAAILAAEVAEANKAKTDQPPVTQ